MYMPQTRVGGFSGAAELRLQPSRRRSHWPLEAGPSPETRRFLRWQSTLVASLVASMVGVRIALHLPPAPGQRAAWPTYPGGRGGPLPYQNFRRRLGAPCVTARTCPIWAQRTEGGLVAKLAGQSAW